MPYAWQEKGNPIIIKSSKSKRINVLGLMNKNLELDYEIIVGKVNSETVIKFLDEFSNDLQRITVVVLDQASIHKARQYY